MQINSGEEKMCNWHVSEIILYLSMKEASRYPKCHSYHKEVWGTMHISVCLLVCSPQMIPARNRFLEYFLLLLQMQIEEKSTH